MKTYKMNMLNGIDPSYNPPIDDLVFRMEDFPINDSAHIWSPVAVVGSRIEEIQHIPICEYHTEKISGDHVRTFVEWEDTHPGRYSDELSGKCQLCTYEREQAERT